MIALAWISGPAISRPLVVGVAWTSCRVATEEPTITIESRKSAASTFFSRTSTKDTVRNEPGPPRQSIHAPLSG